MHFIRPSTYLSLSAWVIVALVLLMLYWTNQTLAHLNHDAQRIKEAASIRGSIQRATKLVLAAPDYPLDQLNKRINSLFADFFEHEQSRRHDQNQALENITTVKGHWYKLYALMNQYRYSPSEELKLKIVDLSELCWRSAELLVTESQQANEAKLVNVKSLYAVLLLNGISAVIVLLLAFFYVRKKLEFQSIHDSLTACYNRRFYQSTLNDMVEQSKRYSSELSYILFDIDYFKNINDKSGHLVGDKVLVELVKGLRPLLRKSDVFCRIGGEEFVLLCPNTNQDEAKVVAENVRCFVQHHNFVNGIEVTVSIGISQYFSPMTAEQLYSYADNALFMAKANGRNRVEVAAPVGFC
jgi:diguanylate cyclase (GGDEF)-like protein